MKKARFGLAYSATLHNFAQNVEDASAEEEMKPSLFDRWILLIYEFWERGIENFLLGFW